MSPLSSFLIRRSLLNLGLARTLRPAATSPKLRQIPIPRRPLHLSSSLREKDKEEEMDELKKNPYYAKYADKLAKMQQTSPEEFLSRLAAAEDAKNKKSDSGAGAAGGAARVQEKEFSFPTQPKKDIKGGSIAMAKEKKLDDRMKVDLLQDKTKEEIAEIWREYHAKKDAVAAVIPADMFKKMQDRFQEFKTFLFPLPRKEGYEFIVVQFEGKEAHFTTLINYQAYTENAPECLSLVHYTELAEEKGIVLMVGEYDTNVLTRSESSCLGVQMLLYFGSSEGDPNHEKMMAHLNRFTYETDEFNHLDLIAELESSRNIPLAPLFQTIQEAQCLANQVELYYCNPSDEKVELMQKFLYKPMEFKHQDLISQLENISLGGN